MEYSLQKQGGKYTITVPKKLVEAKEWEKGDKLKWKYYDKGKLMLEKKQ